MMIRNNDSAMYSKKTLVLSKDYQPLFFVDYKEAFILTFKSRAEVIEYFPKDFLTLKTINSEYKVPAIIRVKVPYKKFSSRNPSRLSIFLRDNFKCGYCGKICNDDEITVDHIIPKSRGGAWSWENLVTACKDCNRKKKNNITYPKYIKPRKPTLFEIQIKKYFKRLHPVIKQFLKPYLKNFEVQ